MLCMTPMTATFVRDAFDRDVLSLDSKNYTYDGTIYPKYQKDMLHVALLTHGGHLRSIGRTVVRSPCHDSTAERGTRKG